MDTIKRDNQTSIIKKCYTVYKCDKDYSLLCLTTLFKYLINTVLRNFVLLGVNTNGIITRGHSYQISGSGGLLFVVRIKVKSRVVQAGIGYTLLCWPICTLIFIMMPTMITFQGYHIHVFNIHSLIESKASGKLQRLNHGRFCRS